MSERSQRPPHVAAPDEHYLRLHLKQPDYSRPLLRLSRRERENILEKLSILYGPARAAEVFPEVERVMQVYYAHKTLEMIADDRSFDPRDRVTERDVVAITYGDLFHNAAKKPLETLSDVVSGLLEGTVNTLHLLPFFPYTSDRGFSVVDYRQVDPALGSWEEIDELGLRFRLMFDGVVNHVSAQSHWFREFLNGNPEYQNFFVTFTTKEAVSDDHLRLILRPRTSDLLTRFQTLNGDRLVWTTFSADQIDLNYQNPAVLTRIIEVLLFYVRHGADIIRLDAATYLWRELGTSCAHLEETHALVQLFRAVLDVAAPHVVLLTETNVPHEDNISYFGDGNNEAHMVYNFALPPLVLRAMRTGNCRRLAEWASQLAAPSPYTTYFNFLDSHDGIGLLGVRGILGADEIEDMIARTLANGGQVSYRTDTNGQRSPYELNIPWFDALNKPGCEDAIDLQVDRFVASRALAMVLMGVPAIYLPSFGGSQFEYAPLPAGAEPRSINRRTIDEDDFHRRLRDPESVAGKICGKLLHLINRRIQAPAFHPGAAQRVMHDHDGVFAVLREAKTQRVLALTNVTGAVQRYACAEIVGPQRDLLTGEICTLPVSMAPYQVMWLTPVG